MLWTQKWIYPYFGYSYSNIAQRSFYELILNQAGNPDAYKFHDVVGNTFHKGRWAWKVADNLDNNAAKCYEWYGKQPNDNYMNAIQRHGASDCPCLYWQIIFDRRFRFTSFHSDMICYKQRATWFFVGTSVSYHTSCCYSLQDRFLINDINPDDGLATQRHISLSYTSLQIRFSARFRSLSRSTAVTEDTKAFEYCCQKSSLCHLYKEKRPVPTCSLYFPPIRGE